MSLEGREAGLLQSWALVPQVGGSEQRPLPDARRAVESAMWVTRSPSNDTW